MMHTHAMQADPGASFVARIVAPAAALDVSSIPGTPGTEAVRARICSGSWLHHLVVRADSARSLRVVMISYEEPGSVPCDVGLLAGIDAFVDALVDEMAVNPDDADRPGVIVPERVATLAGSLGCILHAASLSLANGPSEEGFVDAVFFGAGLPPLVLLEKGHFHFPARSGLPLGIGAVALGAQHLELPLDSTAYLHTCLSGGGDQLRRLHAALPRFCASDVPEDAMLFSVTIAASHGPATGAASDG